MATGDSISDLFIRLTVSATGRAGGGCSAASNAATAATAASVSAGRRHAVLVDTKAGVQDMLWELAAAEELAVDCEGLDLDRHGKLCLLALSQGPDAVFLVDVSRLGAAAFETAVRAQRRGGGGDGGGGGGGVAEMTTVKGLLEDARVRTLLYDVRCDSDALYHQYGVRLQNVLDLQVAEVAVRRHCEGTAAHFLFGLSRALEERLPEAVARRWRLTAVSKTVMCARFSEDPQFWDRRPLSEEQLRYAADDVAYLHSLKIALMTRISARSSRLVHRVLTYSATRTKEYDTPYELLPKGRERARAPVF